MNDMIMGVVANQLGIPVNIVKAIADAVVTSENWEQAVLSGKINTILVAAAEESARLKGVTYSVGEKHIGIVLRSDESSKADPVKTSGPQFFF